MFLDKKFTEGLTEQQREWVLHTLQQYGSLAAERRADHYRDLNLRRDKLPNKPQ